MSEFEVTVTYRIEADTLEDAQDVYDDAGPEIDEGAPIWHIATSDIRPIHA